MCSRARSRMISSGDQQKKSNVFRVVREKETSGKSGRYFDISKSLVQVSLRNCHWKRLPIGFKLM